jgi:hypothetical protein
MEAVMAVVYLENVQRGSRILSSGLFGGQLGLKTWFFFHHQGVRDDGRKPTFINTKIPSFKKPSYHP